MDSNKLTAEEFFKQYGRLLSYNYEWYEFAEAFAKAKIEEYKENALYQELKPIYDGE